MTGDEAISPEAARPVEASERPLPVSPLARLGEVGDSLFRTLIQSSWDVFQLVRPGGIIVYESPASARVLGYSPEEMVGRNALEFVHPEDVERVLQADTELARHGDQRSLCIRVRHKNGAWRWVESFEINLTDDPEVGAIAVNYRDVTERKEAETALLESHRALRLVSRCTEALIHCDNEADLLTTVCNAAVEIGGYNMAWVGYPRDDEQGSFALQAHSGNAREYLKEVSLSWLPEAPTGQGPSALAVRTGEPVIVPDTSKHPSFRGFEKLLENFDVRGVVCLPLRGADRTFGVLVLYLSVVRPITEQELRLLRDMANNLSHGILTLRFREETHQAQRKIAQQAALLDNATDAIFVRDLEHRVTYWNKRAERLYGWTAQEAVGRSVLELLYQPDERDAFGLAMEQLLARGEWAGEFRKYSKGGKQFVVEARWTLVLDEAGEPQAILAINTDVTERRKLEAQFLRSQRLESIGNLAGGIAHDLNNVLAPIILSLDLLKMAVSSRDDAELISVLETSAKHGAAMVSQLLSFSRGVGGVRLNVHLPDLIRDVAKIAQETFPKLIKVRAETAEGLWPVLGDPTQLHQVLLNLCVNARDAMPNGGLLTISAENRTLDAQYAGLNMEAKAGPYVFLQIQDTGTGMPSEMVDKIFDPFFTTKELGKGTGLGLSTVLGIVKDHGGFLRVYTELGKGTKFNLYLPADKEPAGEQTTTEAEMPRGKGEWVLVVDDEPSVRHVTKQTLEAFGYQVITASDGAEAVAVYARQSEQIAAVITDMMMPVMDGMATIHVLQRLNPKLPIIAASGLDANGDAAQAATLGIKGFLNKPYTADKLLQVLRRALDG